MCYWVFLWGLDSAQTNRLGYNFRRHPSRGPVKKIIHLHRIHSFDKLLIYDEFIFLWWKQTRLVSDFQDAPASPEFCQIDVAVVFR